MTFAQKLALAKAGTIVAVAIALYVVAEIASFVSYHYCHGASHNAHGAYCQAVYQDEYSALR